MTITATNRLFLRTKPVRDPDGNLLYVFPEYEPVPAFIRINEPLPPDVVTEADGSQLALIASRRWEILVTQTGLRRGMLKARDRHGNQHNRALRRIEEDHLMKFAIAAN